MGAPKERTTDVSGKCHSVEAGQFQLGAVSPVRAHQGNTSRKSISRCRTNVCKQVEVWTITDLWGKSLAPSRWAKTHERGIPVSLHNAALDHEQHLTCQYLPGSVTSQGLSKRARIHWPDQEAPCRDRAGKTLLDVERWVPRFKGQGWLSDRVPCKEETFWKNKTGP